MTAAERDPIPVPEHDREQAPEHDRKQVEEADMTVACRGLASCGGSRVMREGGLQIARIDMDNKNPCPQIAPYMALQISTD
jgi:hypothetical protein